VPRELRANPSCRLNSGRSENVPSHPGTGNADVPLVRQWCQVTLKLSLLVELAVCVFPSMAALATNDPVLAARWLFLLLLLLAGVHLVLGAPQSALTLVVAALPAEMLLRNMFFFTAVVVLLAIGICGLIVRFPRALNALDVTAFLWLFTLSVAYWFATYVLTGHYFANLRVLELVFSAAAVSLLAQHREYLATALSGILLTALAMGLALWNAGDRLGMGTLNGGELGNPIAFGIPLALLLILTTADGGRWLLLERRIRTRILLAIPVGILLLLSTSRASWLVGATGMLMILLCNRYDRRVAAASLALLGIATIIVLQTRRGASLTTWSERTFSSDRTIAQRTSGRSDQWSVFPAVLKDTPLWGFGPGSGPEIYARYSAHQSDVTLESQGGLQWHSLYQHIAVETGLIGTTAVVLLLVHMFRSNYGCWRRTGHIMPLLGTTGFMLIAITVSGLDAASGLFLGFGLLPWRPRTDGA